MLLVNRLRRTDPLAKPRQLKIPGLGYTSNPQKIVAEFQQHLGTIYSALQEAHSEDSDNFLSGIAQPTIQAEILWTLESTITLEDVEQVIRSLQLLKCLGLDGFRVLYYQKFVALFAACLLIFFAGILKGESLGLDMLTTAVSMLPKPNADHSSWENFPFPFLPISLSNIDVKLLATIMANCLNKGLTVHH